MFRIGANQNLPLRGIPPEMGTGEGCHGGGICSRYDAFREGGQMVDADEFGRIRSVGSLFRAVFVLVRFAARYKLDSASAESDTNRLLWRQKCGLDHRRRETLQARSATRI